MYNPLKISYEYKKNINYRLLAYSDTMSTTLNGNLDFTDNVTSYKLKGDIKNFDVAKFSADTSLNTSLNFSMDAEGENFQLDKVNLYLSTKLYNSYINKSFPTAGKYYATITYTNACGNSLVKFREILWDLQKLTSNWQKIASK